MAPRPSTPDSASVLTDLAQRSALALPQAAALVGYLLSVGVTDLGVCAAFRLGAGSPSLVEGLTADDWSLLRKLCMVTKRGLVLAGPQALNLPTVDPREPERVVGFIRLAPGQHKHDVSGVPAGVACAADIGSQPRVVLVDNPLLGLRLAQAGVSGVAIVEDPAVLLPLLPWLEGRQITLTGYKSVRLDRIREALGPLAAHVEVALLQPELMRTNPGVLALLGIVRPGSTEVPAEVPPVTPHLIHRLHQHALGNVQRGEGAHALQAMGITDAAFAASFQIGYLLPNIRDLLSPAERRSLQGLILGGTAVAFALDEHGVPVDLLAVQACEGGHVTASLFAQPRGLIGAPVITAFDEIVVTDRLRRAARYAADGMRNVILLRDPIDAEQNVARLVRSGVRSAEVRCWRSGDQIAVVLTAAGIETRVVRATRALAEDEDDAEDDAERIDVARAAEPIPFPEISAPATPCDPVAVAPDTVAPPSAPLPDPDAPILQDHDRHTELAIFRAGDLAYAVRVPWDERTTVEVTVSRGDRRHPGTVDLALDVQRRRYATIASGTLTVPAARIARDLAVIHAVLPDLVTGSGRRGASSPSQTAVPGTDREAAMAVLRAPDLLDQLVLALGELGWHGEDDLKRLLILVALSRKLDAPASVVLTSESTPGLPVGLHTIATATPPEDRIQVTRLTDNALLHADPDALRHKVLVIDDLEHVSAAVATSLRVLYARGGLSATQVERDPLHGAVRTRFIEARGPVAVLGAATAGRVHPRLAACLVEVPIDESITQVSASLDADRRRRADAGYAGRASSRVATTTQRLHALQRLIESRPVVLPYADAVAVHPGSPRARLDQQTMLALASASALLHQHQRLSEDGCVVAAPADLALAQRLSGLWAIDAEGGLSRPTARLLAAMCATGRKRFTIEDCALLLPGGTRHGYRVALKEMVRTEYLASPTGGRGRLRVYSRIGQSPLKEDAANRQVGELVSLKPTSHQLTTPDARVG